MKKNKRNLVSTIVFTMISSLSLSLTALAAETAGPGAYVDPSPVTYSVSVDENGRTVIVHSKNSTHSSDGRQGESLGLFKISKYCNCDSCSGGWKTTASGTIPQKDHTIAADTDLYPFGTKLMIDGIIYTVEDTGSSIKGKIIDIYVEDHQTAQDFGSEEREVFSVIE